MMYLPVTMKRFGFRITNRGKSATVLHYRGGQMPIRVRGSIRRVFRETLDAAEAVDELREVALQLAASICAANCNWEFDLEPSEFGYRLVAPPHYSFDIRLLDPEPTKFVLPGGLTLSTARQR